MVLAFLLTVFICLDDFVVGLAFFEMAFGFLLIVFICLDDFVAGLAFFEMIFFFLASIRMGSFFAGTVFGLLLTRAFSTFLSNLVGCMRCSNSLSACLILPRFLNSYS